MIRKLRRLLGSANVVAAAGRWAVRREQARLGGAWESVRFEVAGRPLSDAEAQARRMTLRFAGRRVTLEQHGILEGEYTVDPLGRPGEIDFDLCVADGRLALVGLYELVGDSLTLHLGGIGRGRPPGLTTRPGVVSQVISFRRVGAPG
jgi:uncharacterized protein (TIGR03067 family)